MKLNLKIVFFLFIHVVVYSQNKIQKFEHITLDHGLSQSNVMSIIQDSKGFIWIGTHDGLNRYDGYNFKTYYHDPKDPNSIGNNYVFKILEDNDGYLWIATFHGGLNKFDRKTEKFEKFFFNENDSISYNSRYFRNITIDNNNDIWGCGMEGIGKLNKQTGKFLKVPIQVNDSSEFDARMTTYIFTDKYNAIWGRLKNMKDLVRVTIENNVIVSNKYDITKYKGKEIYKLIQDRNKNIYLGGKKFYQIITEEDDKGYQFSCIETSYSSIFKEPEYLHLMQIDKNNAHWLGSKFGLYKIPNITNLDNFEYYTHDPLVPTTLTMDVVYSSCIDNSGILWLGTNGAGVNKINTEQEKFKKYSTNPYNSKSPVLREIMAICESRDGSIWLGTDDDGLIKYNRETGEYIQFMPDPNNPGSLKSECIWAVLEDHQGHLWAASWGDGLSYLTIPTEDINEINKNSFITYTSDQENSISYNGIYGLYEDEDKNIWVALRYKGVNKWDRKTGIFTNYTSDSKDPSSLVSDKMTIIESDANGNLWFGTNEGLSMLDKTTGKFINYKHDLEDSNSLSNNQVYSLCIAGNGKVWIGTYGGGLNGLDPQIGVFTNFTIEDGLPNNSIYGILEDDHGNLWMSTTNGLSKFDPKSETFRNYDVNDGLQDNEFTMLSSFKSKNGEMFFGGINGFNAFFPDSVKDDTIVPQIAITGFKIFNKEVRIGELPNGRTVLKNPINETKEITLIWADKVFTLEFAALHFKNPAKNQYAFMMEGFEEEWNYVGNRRFATYTNLPQGEYIFKVKASNADAVWNENPCILKINILPPFWKTGWFITLVTLIITGSISYWYWNKLNSIKKQNLLLEKKVQERTIEIYEKNIKLAKLSIVASETENAIAIMDAEANIEWVNDGFTRLHGFNLEEYIEEIGLNLANSSTNPDIKKIVNECINKKKPILYQSYNISKSKKKIWTQTTLTPVLDSNGNIESLVTIESDIRKIKEYEKKINENNEELKQQKEELATQRDALAEANATKDKFFSIISHDLKSPFNTLLGFGEVLLENLPISSKEKIRKYTEQIFISSKQLYSLVDNLLEWSRSKRGTIKCYPENLNLLEAINKILFIGKTSAVEKNIQLTLNCDNELEVYADENLISTIIRNLISNAIKFSEVDSTILISAKENKDFAEISVTDSGIGIKKENLDKLFREDVHFTTKGTLEEKGTGLGLILCKEFAEKNGGTIWVESEFGKGTTFTFTIPLEAKS